MRGPRIDLIAGARPNFMKIAPIVEALRATQMTDRPLAYRLVHTGQHYDRAMSGAFFEQLGLPEPDVNLGVGSGSHAGQTAAIMTTYEALLDADPPEMCLVVGDVNSTLACAITAQKLQVPVAHVEGGLRSGDWTMPEEINRRATDAITDWFFTTSEHANQNLRSEGVEPERIHFVGNTMIDTLSSNLSRLRPADFWNALDLDEAPYIVLTMHRPANVDDPERLAGLLHAVAENSGDATVLFAAHPRTVATLERLADLPPVIRVVPPQPYLQFIHLVKHARAVVTDSGGITEETTVLGIPCLTLRTTTERPETISQGTNVLIGDDMEKLASELAHAVRGEWKAGRVPELWDGGTGKRIAESLQRLVYETGASRPHALHPRAR